MIPVIIEKEEMVAPINTMTLGLQRLNSEEHDIMSILCITDIPVQTREMTQNNGR